MNDSPPTPWQLDYLGMDLSMDEEHIMLSMSNYIDKTLEIMDMANAISNRQNHSTSAATSYT